MYIRRDIEAEIIEMSKQYKALIITGPRQSGKTTTAKYLFSHLPYVSLENPDIRLLSQEDPRAFLNQFTEGAIIDEIQRVPHIFSYLQQILDEDIIGKLFILTGSNQYSLLNSATQSLSGRVAILKMLPLSLNEIQHHNKLSTEELMINGFYPAIYSKQLNPNKAYRNYYESYLERDLRQLIKLKDVGLFQKFVRICAGRISNIFNASAISSEIGVSVKTIQEWISILETSYITFRLPPYFDNINKRLIKSPKLYFYDVGLASYLLGIENLKQLHRDPARGALFENLVVVEAMKHRLNRGMDPQLYFYLDSNHFEIDLVLKKGNLLFPFEIKSAETYHSDFFKGLKKFKKLFQDRVREQFLLFDGDTELITHHIHLSNFRKLPSIMTQLFI